MKLKIATIFALTILFAGCKKDQPTTKETTAQTAEYDDIFRVSFNLLVKQDDNMQVYYTMDGSINFTEEESVWTPVKGSAEAQEVVFTLPEGVIPSRMRVDFGHGVNETQSDVEVRSFKMSYRDKNFTASGVQLFDYFTAFEPYTEVVPGTSTIKRLKKNQDVGPVLYPKETLAEKINEITGGQSPE